MAVAAPREPRRAPTLRRPSRHPRDAPRRPPRAAVAHLFRALEDEVEAAGFLERGGRLVVFSDHGARFALTPHNFEDPQYHHVLLATLGLPARCPAAPISLIDIGTLAGLGRTRAEPSVEFTVAQSGIWPALVETARLRWPGDVDLDRGLLGQLFGELRRHTPWTDEPQGACDVAGGPGAPPRP